MAYLYYLINETVKLNKENIFGLRTVNSELQCVCVCVFVCVTQTNFRNCLRIQICAHFL